MEFETAEVFCEEDEPKSTDSEIPPTGCRGKKNREGTVNSSLYFSKMFYLQLDTSTDPVLWLIV